VDDGDDDGSAEGEELGMDEGAELGDSVGQFSPQIVVSEDVKLPVVGVTSGVPS